MIRTLGTTLLLAALALALLSGCGEEDLEPYFTRISADNYCGKAPMEVEMYAIVSGGNELDEPTGANLFLDLTWDFGDGATGSGSLVRHTFIDTGTFEVTVTVKDKDDDTSVERFEIQVLPDSMRIWVLPTSDRQPDTDVIDMYETDGILLTCQAELCDFNDDYTRFFYRWYADSIDASRQTYLPTRTGSYSWVRNYVGRGPGQYRLIASIEDVSRSIVRRDTLEFDVTPCPGGLSADTLRVYAEALAIVGGSTVPADGDPSTPNLIDVSYDTQLTLNFDAEICGFDDEFFRFEIGWYNGRYNVYRRFATTPTADLDFRTVVNDTTIPIILRVRDRPYGIVRVDTLFFGIAGPPPPSPSR